MQSRLEVNIGQGTREALHELMSDGTSATEVVRRAISLLAFVEQQEKLGHTLALLQGGEVREVRRGE